MMSPKEVLKSTYDKAGGILQMSSSGEVSRNLRQVYNVKGSQSYTSGLTSSCDKDLVYDLLEQHYLSENNFVRSVSFSDGVMSVVGTNQQLDNVLRFVLIIIQDLAVFWALTLLLTSEIFMLHQQFMRI